MSNFQIRKVILPSGRNVEIVYFQGEEWDATDGIITRLENCLHCDMDFVHPLSRRQLPNGLWELHLRCHNCEHEETSVWAKDDVERFNLILARQYQSVVDELERQRAANMTDYKQRFVRALRTDNIVPEDF